MSRLRQRRIFLGSALGGAYGDVVPGGLVAVHTDQGDAPQGAVGVAVAAAVQPVPVSAAGGHRDRRHTAQARERPLRAQTASVVSGGYQQLPGGVHADAGQRDQLRRGRSDQRSELGIQVVDLGLQGLPAARQGPQRSFSRCRRIGDRAGPQGSAGTDALARIQLAQLAADLLRGGGNDRVDLGTALDPGLHRAAARDSQNPDHLHLGVP